MQGFNMGRYVPPEHEGVVSANRLAGKNALGARARKSAQGILTVRFEMPFAIWCTTCKPPAIIGQGVRFNAEKKKVGNYYSSPIFSFRMKHVTCGGWIEIRTDPKNTAYVVTEGAKKRDVGENKVLEGEIMLKTAEEKLLEKEDALQALEKTIEDRRVVDEGTKRIDELKRLRDRDWEDPYSASRKLRTPFRTERKLREVTESNTEALKDRMSLGIDLLAENEDDRRRAGFIEFGEIDRDDAIVNAASKPLYGNTQAITKHTDRNRSVKSAKRRKDPKISKAENLGNEIRRNTRMAVDPFLTDTKDWKPTAALTTLRSSIKRKRESAPDESSTENNTEFKEVASDTARDTTYGGMTALGLVDYDSDD